VREIRVMCGIGESRGRRPTDKLILIAVLGCRLLRAGIVCGVLMRIRGGTGKSELWFCVGRCPIMIVLCLRLSFKVWIMKSRRGHQ
jgi:hypothetical protein